MTLPPKIIVHHHNEIDLHIRPVAAHLDQYHLRCKPRPEMKTSTHPLNAINTALPSLRVKCATAGASV
jgi:hypothetical protein